MPVVIPFPDEETRARYRAEKAEKARQAREFKERQQALADGYRKTPKADPRA